MDRGAWQATVHGSQESDTTEHTHILRILSRHFSWRRCCLCGVGISMEHGFPWFEKEP